MNTQNLFKIIADLVSFETVYPNKQEFFRCIQYIKHYFSNSELYIEEFEHNDEKSLVISTHKVTDFDVIFCGHIDVVPAPKTLFKVRKDGDFIYGRGVSDMKGQVAIMMQVMENLSRGCPFKKVALFLTSDEERGGFDGVGKLLEISNYSGSVAIVPDGGFNYTLVSEAKGVLQLKVSTTGIDAHSSEPWNGENAILKLFDVVKQISHKFPNPKNHLDWRTSFNISKIDGGNHTTKVPSIAFMIIDIRYTYVDKIDHIINFIKSIDPLIDVEILALGEVFQLDSNSPYVKKYISICRESLGKDVQIVKCHTASDGRFFAKKNIPCLIMNPIGGNIHSNDEWVSLSSLNELKTIYGKYLT
jgi:succinyl-diaminopimelate desuccinylase